jgi:hypothetical protein
MVGASAQASEPAMKIMIASRMMARRPWISESFPNSGVVAVAARRYAVTTQERSSILARLLPIAGSAGATMVCSSAERNIASMMPAIILRIAA